MKPRITVEELRRVLDYDPGTGIFRWKVKIASKVVVGARAGTLFKDRVQIRIYGVIYRSARLAWLYVHGVWPKGMIDHRNHVTDDNSIGNLRDVTCKINNQNKISAKCNSKTGVLGVSPMHRGKKFRARIDGRQIGLFNTIEEAQAAYIAAKRQLHEGNML